MAVLVPALFLTECAEPILFYTKDLPQARQVDEAIIRNAGEVTDEVGPYTVCLVPEPTVGDMNVLPPHNTFSVTYVTDCVNAMKLKPLKNYWVHKMIDFDDKIDPVDVMMGKLTWNDCRKEIPSSTSGSSPRNSDDEIFHQVGSLEYKPRQSSRKFRNPYTMTERIKMLEYIQKKRLHNSVNGNAMWKRMEEKRVCPGRTWQSMKEHFRRYILQQLNQFPSHLSAGFRHSSQIHGSHRTLVPAAPHQRQHSSHKSDEDTDTEDASINERDNQVELTKDKRTKESKDEGTYKSLACTQKRNMKSVQKSSSCMPPPAVTDKRGQNINQINSLNEQDLQQARAEEKRERGNRKERTNQLYQGSAQKEQISENIKESRHLFVDAVHSDKKEQSEKGIGKASIPYPKQFIRQQQQEPEERDESEETSLSMILDDTEEVKTNEPSSEERKKVEHSKSHLSSDAEELIECEINEGELSMDSPSIITSCDTFLMDRHSAMQESQGFIVALPIPGETEKKDCKSGITSQGENYCDRQQEPDSSIEILKESEEWLKSVGSAQLQFSQSSEFSNNHENFLHSMATQKKEGTLSKAPVHQLSDSTDKNASLLPNKTISSSDSMVAMQTLATEKSRSMSKGDEEREESESSLKEISESSMDLTNVVIHSDLLIDKATEELCKTIDSLTASSEASLYTEVFNSTTNTTQHYTGAKPSTQQALVEEDQKKTSKENAVEKIEREEEKSHRIGSRAHASLTLANNILDVISDAAVWQDRCTPIHSASTSVRKKQEEWMNEQQNKDQETESEDEKAQSEEIEVEEEVEVRDVDAEEYEQGDDGDGDEHEDDSSANEGEVGEENENEEEAIETRKETQGNHEEQRIMPQPSHSSCSLLAKNRRMAVTHTSSHTASEGPSMWLSKPRKCTLKEHSHQSHTAPPRTKTRNSGAYTLEEDLAIISYIRNEDAYDRVAGRALWEEMAAKFISGRTWQSLKERFRKRIMVNLHVYTAHGVKDMTISRFKRRVTMKTGSNARLNEKHRRKKVTPHKQQSSSQSGAGCELDWRVKGSSSSESEEESESDSQETVSRIRSRRCTRNKQTNMESSRILVRRHRKVSKQTVSEDSDIEKSCMDRKTRSCIPGQPHHTKEKHQLQQHQGHTYLERLEAKREKKILLTASSSGMLRGKQSSASVTSKLDKFKAWKLKILQEAHAKTDGSKHLCKKRRILDPREVFLSPPKTPISYSSHNFPKSFQQRKNKGDGSQMSSRTQERHKQQTANWKNDLGNTSDNQEENYNESEPRCSKSRDTLAVQNDMEESDQGSLPDLSANSGPYQHQDESKEEREENNSHEENEDSDGSENLFEIEWESE